MDAQGIVNINIPLPDSLHKKLKLKAVIKGITLKDLIIHALEKKVRK